MLRITIRRKMRGNNCDMCIILETYHCGDRPSVRTLPTNMTTYAFMNQDDIHVGSDLSKNRDDGKGLEKRVLPKPRFLQTYNIP